MHGHGDKAENRDERTVHERIEDALEADPALEASGIEILVDGNEIFLSGTVFRAHDRVRAEEIVRRVVGGDPVVYNRLGLFGDGPVAESNLNVDTTVDGATMHTENGGYDELS
jgi:hypothetical protein